MEKIEEDVEKEKSEEEKPESAPESSGDSDNVAGETVEDEKSKEGKPETAPENSGDRDNVESGPDTDNGMDEANLRYEGDICIHTDPESKFEHYWDEASQSWLAYKGQLNKENTENDANNKEGAPPGNYEFDGDSYVYSDSSGVTYKWDSAQNEWKVKDKSAEDSRSDSTKEAQHPKDGKKALGAPQDMSAGHYGFEGDTHTYTDPSDGTVYFWDREKNAWFPKVDDDFMAQYQMNYGFVDPNAGDTGSSAAKDAAKDDKQEDDDSNAGTEGKAVKRKAAPNPPQWFELDQKENTKVYVSNLPLDVTLQEFIDIMQKCGLIMRDVDTGNMKVKLYTEPGNNKQLKGDGLCTYIKKESVELALNLLDGSDLRGKKLKVERACFTLKGQYNPDLKPKKKRRKDKEKIKKAQEKLFDWRPDKMRGERSKHERTVIVKNLFEPKAFDMEVSLILEYQQDLREEGSKCGEVKKVIIYDRHPEGVAQLSFRSPEEADLCVQLLNNRWFNQRKLTAETWDGKTKYKIAETPEEAEARLAKWSKYLESEEAKKSALENNHNAGLEGGEDEEEEDEDKGVGKEVKTCPVESNSSKNSENSTNSNTENNDKEIKNVPGDDSDTGSDDGKSDEKET